jgi:serine protease Do
MDLYHLPKFDFSYRPKKKKHKNLRVIILSVSISVIFGFLAGAFSSSFFYFYIDDNLARLESRRSSLEGTDYDFQSLQEAAVINSVKKSSPAVVSIIITKDVPILEKFLEIGPFGFTPQYRQKGTERKEIGGGTGFIVSSQGLILTNKHVVLDDEADYTIFTNDGRKFPARVLAKDPYQDIAVMMIEQESKVDESGNLIIQEFPVLKLADSDNLEIGQTVIAIGNALAEFKNTVSAGVISGLGRRITASGGSGFVETLEDIIQTDAAINKGNSGGPLLNLKGEVIGINTAMALEAQSIGFAIPINKAKRDIEQIQTIGRIVYPFIGIRYVLVNEKVKEEYGLNVDYGALIVEGGPGEPAISPDSPADQAGLEQGDLVLELNGERISLENSLAKIIAKYNPGDEVVLKVLKGGEEKDIKIILIERPD